MAVRVGERSKSRLDAQMRCEELVRHTVHICSNERVFDHKYAAFTARIVDTAITVGLDMWKANGIKVGDSADRWRTRHALQEDACMQLDALLYLMGVARRLYHLRSGKYEHWARLAIETRDLARKWRDSDARRYGHLVSGT